ncbi:probable E3 ubiquitin-protein ligase HIP1 [Chenopodium quinoa]|uniref:probable E3 ubiquitin-protein ligase HIP1 n=1 Tax=Chenopodium quinoa TaxID=63459 RepID=UPI000B76D291|nr:probable E3 ubiquitin-protein ligase HIP1 [Chenopodium quinoa]
MKDHFSQASGRRRPNYDSGSASLESAESANRLTGIRTYHSQGRSSVPNVASRRRGSASLRSAESANRPTGSRTYRSQGRSSVPNVASRRSDLPRLRTLPVDEVALLEFPNVYEVDYNVQSIIDYHRDMRWDIDDMSYAVSYPPFLAARSSVPTSDGMLHNFLPISQEIAEPSNRPTGIRTYRSQGRSLVPAVASRRRDLPRLRTLPVDGVALLEFPNLYEVDYNVESINDNQRNMRLDIDNMSYAELLALSERIGTVCTGLTEKDIRCHLKTRRYKKSTAATINSEELSCRDQTNDLCIICQDEYEDNEQLGTLECGHEYHVDCLKKWLLLKNVCPICKSTALVLDR